VFDLRVDDDGVIHVKGRLDAAQSKKVERVLGSLDTATVVDCRDLDYISSAGLGLLFAAHQRLAASGGALRLVHLSPHIREVFAIAGFDTFFDLDSSPTT
jgi:anti-sigma B factor antagonist